MPCFLDYYVFTSNATKCHDFGFLYLFLFFLFHTFPVLLSSIKVGANAGVDEDGEGVDRQVPFGLQLHLYFYVMGH